MGSSNSKKDTEPHLSAVYPSTESETGTESYSEMKFSAGLGSYSEDSIVVMVESAGSAYLDDGDMVASSSGGGSIVSLAYLEDEDMVASSSGGDSIVSPIPAASFVGLEDEGVLHQADGRPQFWTTKKQHLSGGCRNSARGSR